MPWHIIKQSSADIWNEKLKGSNAVYTQYPYYVSAEYSSIFSRAVCIEFTENNKQLAFAAIIEIGIRPFKFGVIDGGPTILQPGVDPSKLLEELKIFAKKQKFIHIQIRPVKDSAFYYLLETDKEFKNEIFFPFHKKVDYDWNIYNKPEKELLAGFKLQGRRKIVLAGRLPFTYRKIEDVAELKEVKELFRDVTDEKGYRFAPFSVFKALYINGHKHGLCDIYAAYLDEKLVNAVLIVKDSTSYYHYISGLRVIGFKANESPPAKLHFYVMQDCFYNEHKEFYNISYGGSENLIRFKELYNPVEIEKPSYYTYVISKKKLDLFSAFSIEKTDSIRRFIKNVSSIFSKSSSPENAR